MIDENLNKEETQIAEDNVDTTDPTETTEETAEETAEETTEETAEEEEEEEEEVYTAEPPATGFKSPERPSRVISFDDFVARENAE